MSKRGTAFVRIIAARQRKPAVWDPHRYHGARMKAVLGDYVEVYGLRRLNSGLGSPFRAIEYSDISQGDHLTFALEEGDQESATTGWAVGEQELLMGTMRAYLGNIIVTPRAAWLARRGPLWFAVKSEFVRLAPRDGLIYFWWAYLRTAGFLSRLPVGSGGTRPRLQPDALTAAAVNVPELNERKEINRQLEACASREWREMLRRRAIIKAARLSVY